MSNSETVKTWVEVGYKRMGKDFKKALEAFNKALNLDPDCVDALNGIGLIYQDEDRLKDAREAFERALAIAPNETGIWDNYIPVLVDIGDIEGGIYACEQLFSLDPEDYFARRGQAVLRGKTGRARQ